jgi:hypothetical protein
MRQDWWTAITGAASVVGLMAALYTFLSQRDYWAAGGFLFDQRSDGPRRPRDDTHARRRVQAQIDNLKAVRAERVVYSN